MKNMDTLRSKESGIVEVTLRERKKIETVGRKMDVNDILSKTDPYPLKETQEMGMVVFILIRSLDKDRYQNTLQYNSVRKIRFVLSNVWHVSNNTLTTSDLSKDMRKTYLTSYATYLLWSERFIMGIHTRMFNEVR